MSKVIIFNKPYAVVSQFSPAPPQQCLKDFIDIPDVYPAGRLDSDSEGLLLLTDNGKLQAQIADPKFGKWKTYWVQVEGESTPQQLAQLTAGVNIADYWTKPAFVKQITEPNGLWPRTPPIRQRKSIPTSWLELAISEGKNRQVRRMTAKVGLPTLRLIRVAIGNISLGDLAPGAWYQVSESEFRQQFNRKK